MTAREELGVEVTEQQLQPVFQDFAEMGVIDELPFSGGFGANELVDSKEITLQQIQEMRRKDGQARAIHRVLTLPLRTAALSVIPHVGNRGGGDGEEEAEFVKMALTEPLSRGGMSTSINKVLAHMGMALADGFAVFEKVWQITADNKFTLRKLAPRGAATVKFNLDEHGGLESVRQRVHWQGEQIDVTIPSDKLLVYTAQHEENAWYGESYLLPAYYHYDKKHKIYYISHLASQFHAIPGRIGTYPAQAAPADRKTFREQLAKMGFNTAMTKPVGYEIEPFGGGGGMPDYEKLINHHDAMMAKSVLAHFIQLGTGSSSGSWALSEDQSDFFTIALETILAEWSEIFTFYVAPQLVDFNFNTGAYPEIKFGPLSDQTRDVMADVFQTLSASSTTNVTAEFMFEIEKKIADVIGLEIDYEALEEDFKKKKEMEEAASAAALLAFQSAGNRDGAGIGSPDEEDEDDDDN